MKITKIDGVNNYYGALHVKKELGKYYMDVKCELNGFKWKEIKKELYDLIIEFNNENWRNTNNKLK